MINTGLLDIKPFDPFPFSFLIGIINVEALIISTFVLVSQNRQREEADRRADLDLQMSLLNQYELTRALRMLDSIQDELEIENDDDEELRALEEDVSPEDVLIEMDLVQRRAKEIRERSKLSSRVSKIHGR